MHHVFHGLRLAFEPPLRGFSGARFESTADAESGPLLAIRRVSARETRRLWEPRREDWVVRDPTHLSVAVTAHGVVLESYCGSRAWLSNLPSGESRELHVRRGRHITTDRYEHTLLHQFLPVVLTACGEMMLHAASVVVEGRAVLFCGASGMGKSTLAAGFAASGLPVLAEDIARVAWIDGQAVTYASYPGTRLRANSFLLPDGLRARNSSARYGLPKYRVHLDATPRTAEPWPLAAIMLLRRARQVSPRLERFRPVEALPSVLEASFFQALDPTRRSREAIERCARLIRSVPIHGLAYRRSAAHFDCLLSELQELLHTHVCRSQATG